MLLYRPPRPLILVILDKFAHIHAIEASSTPQVKGPIHGFSEALRMKSVPCRGHGYIYLEERVFHCISFFFNLFFSVTMYPLHALFHLHCISFLLLDWDFLLSSIRSVIP